MVPCSQLRIYEPLESFPEEARSRWAASIRAGAPLPAAWPYRETSFGGANGEHPSLGLLYPATCEHAFVRRVNGRWLVSPWRIELGVLTGILAFRTAVAGEPASVLVPEREADRAASDLEQFRQANPGERDNVAVAAWHVPFAWLVAFDDGERLLSAEGGPSGAGPFRRVGRASAARLRYETDLAQALHRLRRASAILADSAMEESVGEPVAELEAWMGGFDPESTVELDYWSLTGVVPAEELENDRSAGEIWACLEATELGDLDESRRRWIQLTAWWDRVRALERAS